MDLIFKPLEDWGLNFKEPMVIAGPCSAETYDQVISTAMELSNFGVHVLRAGIWKPRTRPNVFQGVGDIGLKWLQEASRQTGLPVAVEVANAKHVELSLKHEIDILWIGARTSVNPFAVQEIADALKGVDIPVLIKNPVNPDLELWIGAIERIYQRGITRIAAIHRGFSSYDVIKYRNRPSWEIPIELKRRYPDLPLLCDPSHITGNKDLLLAIAQKAIDLNYNGLMIESHYNPSIALSDKEQQITPDELGSLLSNLIIRKKIIQDAVLTDTLGNLREIIDALDSEMLELLAKRMDIVGEIGSYKRENNITIFQPDRWNEIVLTRTKEALEKKLSKDLILKIFESIHQESIRKQVEVMNALIAIKEEMK